ncbi:MAG: flavin reductase [Clostridiales bacterium]|nr:flavin reductase [Clostridiales bacterium]
MKQIRRASADRPFSLCVQPAFLIGTNNGDGTPDFAPITWVSATCEQGEDYLLVISMFGGKRTRQNVERTGVLSANLVSVDMLPIMDYCGTHHAGDGKMDAFPWGVSRGEKVDVPTLDESRWVYECEVEKTVKIGRSATFFCRIRNIQIDIAARFQDAFDVDLTKLDPVIYSGKYHSIGKMLGCIGDFSTQMGDEKQ